MELLAQVWTPEIFDEYALLPENRHRLLELIGGELVEVVASPGSSNIGMLPGSYITQYVVEHDLGHTTGADGGYRVGQERYIPDVGFISYARQPELQSVEGYNPLPPDLAVEVVSPNDRDEDIEIKVANYLAAGTTVWLVREARQRISIFKPGQPVIVLGINDVLDGGDLLPGFTLPLSKVFRRKSSS
jgi:Uma2 family endonuclease